MARKIGFKVVIVVRDGAMAYQTSGSQGAVNIEETNGILERTLLEGGERSIRHFV